MLTFGHKFSLVCILPLYIRTACVSPLSRHIFTKGSKMSGFSFGQPTTGFTFGTPKTTSGATPVSGFGLTNTTTAQSGGGGFSFPPQTSVQAPASSSQAGSLFSLPVQGTQSTQGGFSFSTPAQSSTTGGGFTFSLPAVSQPATTGLTLGSLAAPSSGSGFTFGAGLSTQTTAAQPQASTGGFSLVGSLAAQPSGGFTFGGAKVQVAAGSTATVGGGFTFGSTTLAPTTTAASQPSATFNLGTQPTGLILGSPAPATTTTAITTQGTGFSFGIKPSATPAPTPAPASTTGPTSQTTATSLFSTTAGSAASAGSTGFTLGATTTAGSTATTSAATGSLGLLLKPLVAAPTTTTTTASATTSAATTFSLGLKPVGTMAPVAGTATSITTATTSAASAPPVMTYAQLEALINKWSLELEDQERHFLHQATQVNAWDRMLVENGEKITSLHKEMEKVKLDQRRLDQELDFILSQQKELEDLLCPLEESVKEQSGTIYMQNADEERERTYKLAENVDAQLKRMSQDLKEIIDHLNTSSGPADTSDPLQQICKILNAHMDSLQWVDQNSVLLQRRVEEVSKLCESRRKEQEKSFHINFE
ncbi:nuclear pore glycoprotein p62-like [Arapaima gigas]